MQPNSQPAKLCYSIPEAVIATGLGRTSLYEQIRAGRLRTLKVGRRTLIAADDLAAWLASLSGGRTA